MKALVADAEWKPRKGYLFTDTEQRLKRAAIGSQVWRNPRFAVKDAPVPRIKDDEVLIRVKACGICGSDTHLYETDDEGYIIFSGPAQLPCILGHEFSGVVEKIGKRVAGLKKGDKVAAESVMWCGICHPCRSGFPNQCSSVELTGLSADGALAEYAAVRERYCWKIGELGAVYSGQDIFDAGALIEPAGCAYNGIFIAGGGFSPGAACVIYGAGPIGLSAVALARAAGAGLIIVFDVLDERIELARAMGADYGFNARKLRGAAPKDKVLQLTGNCGADIQVEAAGAAPATIPEMEKSMAVNGKIIYLGRAATKTPMYLDALVSGANKIIGSRGHAGGGIFANIIKLIAGGRLDLAKMITARYPFQDVLKALEFSSKRTGGKIMVQI